MKIDLRNHIPLDELSFKNGFGYAAEHIMRSLDNLGYELGEENADIELWWDQPHWIEWGTKGAYRVAYFPWESTELLPGWKEILEQADEIWTPSELIASWLRELLTPPVYVYEHGVDHIWTPRKRERPDTIRYLHLGFEAARKHGPQTMQAFRKAFSDHDDVQLIMKTHMPSWKVDYVGKIEVVNKKLDIKKLVKLFDSCDVFLFASAGEGFGLPPLQAMASGMPTIINDVWAPYGQFLDNNLTVDSKLVVSPWQDIHPGMMYRPDFDDLIDKMRYSRENFEQVSEYAFTQASLIHSHYSWDRLTKEAFEALESRLK